MRHYFVVRFNFLEVVEIFFGGIRTRACVQLPLYFLEVNALLFDERQQDTSGEELGQVRYVRRQRTYQL